MSKKEVDISVYLCDHVNEDGERCGKQGDREAMFVCCVCSKDLCLDHCDLSTVQTTRFDTRSIRAGHFRYVYPFCFDHMDTFMNLLLEKFGEGYEKPVTSFMQRPGASGTHFN